MDQDFPGFVSFTVTNACNLRCQMCAQWSPDGYIQGCPNVERLFDVQPTGEASFCVDFPDFSYGNVRDASIAMLWNNEHARRFRERRRQKPFSACHRCGAKYMAMVRD